MKILVVCQHYFPENFQITEICEQLVANGHFVTAIVGLPNYPKGIVPDDYKHGRHRRENINGVNVVRCFEIGRRKGPFWLSLNYLSFWFSSIRTIKKLHEKYDVVLGYELSPVMMVDAGRVYSEKNKIPFVVYCCDLWPESVKMYVKSETNPIFKFAKRISKKIYSSANTVLCNSKSFISYLHSVNDICLSKLLYLPAFADENLISEDLNKITTNENQGRTDFLFAGNIGMAQNLENVIKSFSVLKTVTDNFILHIVGSGSFLEQLRNIVHETDLDQYVLFHGRHPASEMPDFYRMADVCIVSLKSDSAVGLTLPSKVQGYMAAGKAIVGMIDGSARDVIEEASCGLSAGAMDVKAFSEVLLKCTKNRAMLISLGENGRRYYRENFSKKNFMNRLTSILGEIQKNI